MTTPLRVTVWNEFRHERSNPVVGRIYPDGIHEALAAPLREAGHAVRTATLDEPEHGLGGEVLEQTDVLLWWGHQAMPRSPTRWSSASRRGCSRAWA
jgi:trehalose utilization protein